MKIEDPIFGHASGNSKLIFRPNLHTYSTCRYDNKNKKEKNNVSKHPKSLNVRHIKQKK